MKTMILTALLLIVSSVAQAAGVECDAKAGVIKSAQNNNGGYTTVISVTEITSARYAKAPCPAQKGQTPYQDIAELDRHYMPGTRLELYVEFFPVKTSEGGETLIGKWKVKK